VRSEANEVHADGAEELVRECVLGVAKQQAAFADTGVTDQHDFWGWKSEILKM
jgi:hypothetical protein